tara:strand:- start:194 stop:508 length:315 start_codon:yes stop_codon:yes gene_type:complete
MLMKKNFFLILILFFLTHCGSFADFRKAVTGQKEITTDEFLIKKKDPLILPPEYEKLPVPGTKSSSKDTKDSLENILKKEDSANNSSKSISDLENQVLRELRKN